MSDMIAEFVAEAQENLDAMAAQLVQFEADPRDADALAAVFRLLHTLKGTCGFLGLPQLEAMAHRGESLLEPFRGEGAVVDAAGAGGILDSLDAIKAHLAYIEREGREPDLTGPESTASAHDEATRGDHGGRSIRISLKVLDELMTLAPELVVARNQLLRLDADREDSPFAPVLQRLSSLTRDIQESVTRARMQQIGVAWRTFPRLVRDLSMEVGKPVRLLLEGEETELDRQVMELIRDPLTHMLRNAVDHGLEPGPARLAAGKPEIGTIRLSASHRGAYVVLRMADDGRGLDAERIRAKALERGLATLDALATMSSARLYQLIFAPGFSTAEAVTNLSGRGVGMDVVRSNVEALGGEIDVDSVPGQGAVFTISLPLTLAVTPALIVAVAAQRFAIPQSQVREVVRVGAGASCRIQAGPDGPIIRLRGATIPIVALDRHLQLRSGAFKADAVLIAQLPGGPIGVPVDSVLNIEDVVVKPLPGPLRGLAIFSGVTVLGDGAILLIADVNALASHAPVQLSQEAGSTPSQDAQARGEQTQYLLFRAGGRTQALDITRIERVLRARASQLHEVAGQMIVDYGGRPAPVLPMHDGTASAPAEPVRSLLMLANGEQPVALAVDEILAVVPACGALDVAAARTGVLGGVLLGDVEAEVIDADWRLDQGSAAYVLMRAAAGRQAA